MTMSAADDRVMSDRLIAWAGDGATASLSVRSSEAYNRDTRARTNTPTTYTVRYAIAQRILDNEDGTVTKTDTLRVSVSASDLPAGVVPDTTSTIVIGGKTYRVTDCEPLGGVAGSPASYELEIAP